MIDSCQVLFTATSHVLTDTRTANLIFGLKVTLSQFPFAGTQQWTVLTETCSGREQTFFFRLTPRTRLKGQKTEWQKQTLLRKIVSTHPVFRCDWVPWWLITLERREGKRIKSPIIPVFFSWTPWAPPFFISSKCLSPFLLCSCRHVSVCLSVTVLFPLCNFSLVTLSLFPWSFGFSETRKMGRAAAYLISQHARGSVVNHLGLLTVTHQHISKQGHDTCTRSLYWHGRGSTPAATFIKVWLNIWLP